MKNIHNAGASMLVVEGLDQLKADGKITEEDIKFIIRYLAQAIFRQMEAFTPGLGESMIAETASGRGMPVEEVKNRLGIGEKVN